MRGEFGFRRLLNEAVLLVARPGVAGGGGGGGAGGGGGGSSCKW